MKNFRPANRKERGQSLVELGLTITILMALLAGTIDLGRAFFTWLALRDAAQEGAAYLSVFPSGDLTCSNLNQPAVCDRIWDNLSSVIPDAKNVTVATITFPGGTCLGNTLVVEVAEPNFPLTMPFLGIFMGNTMYIKATVTDTVLHFCP